MKVMPDDEIQEYQEGGRVMALDHFDRPNEYSLLPAPDT